MVKIRKANALTGLDIALANALQFNTPLISFTFQSSMTRNPSTIATWYRQQMEEAIHMWNTTTNHAERNYWQGYGTAMKWALHKFTKDFIHDDITD